MPRTAKSVRLWKRGETFYYRLKGSSSWRSTGCKNRTAAEAYVLEHTARTQATRASSKDGWTLREYLKPFYTDACPHARRLQTEGKSIGKHHLKAMRSLVRRLILTDSIADLRMADLRRGDVLNFRERIRGQVGPRAVNRTLQALKTSIREGIYREELSKDPTQGIGNIRYEIDVSGTFTQAEIAAMFQTCPGPWLEQEAYTFFLLLYVLGLRRGEALGLRWSSINLDSGEVQIREALTESRQMKKPKWEKTRVGRIGQKTIVALRLYRIGRQHVLGDSFVFGDAEGQPHAPGWALYRFEAVMKALKIDRKARHLRIHSFRHSSHSHLIAAGLSPELARIAFGWSDEQVQRGYTHVGAEDLVGQARIMDTLIG